MMPYYLSQHPDYTNAERPSDVDCPAPPRFIEAKNAKAATKENYRVEVEEAGGSVVCDQEDLDSGTTLVLLDPLFDIMRGEGWTVSPPTRS